MNRIIFSFLFIAFSLSSIESDIWYFKSSMILLCYNAHPSSLTEFSNISSFGDDCNICFSTESGKNKQWAEKIPSYSVVWEETIKMKNELVKSKLT